MVEGVYASESTLHSSVAFLRNTLSGAAGRAGRGGAGRAEAGSWEQRQRAVLCCASEECRDIEYCMEWLAAASGHASGTQLTARAPPACLPLPASHRPGLLPGAQPAVHGAQRCCVHLQHHLRAAAAGAPQSTSRPRCHLLPARGMSVCCLLRIALALRPHGLLPLLSLRCCCCCSTRRTASSGSS